MSSFNGRDNGSHEPVPRHPAAGGGLNVGTILAIDDDVTGLTLLQDLLSMSGYEVHAAGTGLDGIALFHQHKPHLVITDIRMPQMDGLEVLRRIRDIDHLVPVVIVTGHGDLDLAIKAIRDGAYDFIQKPINPELLLKTVRQGVEHHRLRQFEKEHLRVLEQQVEERTRELAETNDFLRGILESSTSVSIILTDFSREVLFWNSGAENIFGYKEEEMIGQSISKLYGDDPANVDTLNKMREAVEQKGGAFHAKVKQMAKDGRALTMALVVSPMLEASGKLRGILGVGQDITEEERLHEELLESYGHIKRIQGSSIFALAKLAESRDGETGDHLKRIQEYSRLLCKYLREQEIYTSVMTEQFIYDLVQSSVLHDIGKVTLPDSILFSPGKFGMDEYEIMKQHALFGGRALEEAALEAEDETFLSMGRDVAYYHHERWDGKGYPFGLEGEETPLAARIVAIADVYDALTTARRYKRSYSHEEACSIISENRGKQFDPDLVDAFMEVEHLFREIREAQAGRLEEPSALDTDFFAVSEAAETPALK